MTLKYCTKYLQARKLHIIEHVKHGTSLLRGKLKIPLNRPSLLFLFFVVLLDRAQLEVYFDIILYFSNLRLSPANPMKNRAWKKCCKTLQNVQQIITVGCPRSNDSKYKYFYSYSHLKIW